MPRGHQGQKRPADVIENALTVARVATGDVADTGYDQPNKAKGGRAGSAARDRALTPERRREIAAAAAAKRRAKQSGA